MEANKTKFEISLTGILVQDKNKGYTAFFAQFPHIIAEGDTEEEATKNLFSLVKDVFEFNKKQEVDQVFGMESVHTRSFELATAVL